MARWLLLGSCVALAACAGTPATAPPSGALSAGPMESAPDRSSDAPATPIFRGLRWPSLRGGWGTDDERPDWLPTLPANPQRYPVPEDWPRDSLAKMQPRATAR